MPLEELAGLFQGKLTTLQQCLQLRDCKGDSAIETLTASIEHGVSDLEVVLTLMRAEVTQRKKALIVVQVNLFNLPYSASYKKTICGMVTKFMHCKIQNITLYFFNTLTNNRGPTVMENPGIFCIFTRSHEKLIF